MLFFISPAYPEAHTRTTLRSKSTPMNVSEFVRSLSGSVSNPGTEITVQFGSKLSSSSGEGRLKSWRTKRACQAHSVTMWTSRR
jgi:hypothetical protein